jgi:hypothetical protein
MPKKPLNPQHPMRVLLAALNFISHNVFGYEFAHQRPLLRWFVVTTRFSNILDAHNQFIKTNCVGEHCD